MQLVDEKHMPALTFAEVIEPFKTRAIMDACDVSESTVFAWRRGGIPQNPLVLRPLSRLTGRSVDFIVASIERIAALGPPEPCSQ